MRNRGCRSSVNRASNGLVAILMFVLIVGVIKILAAAIVAGLILFGIGALFALAFRIGQHIDHHLDRKRRQAYTAELTAWRLEQERRRMQTAPRQHPNAIRLPQAAYSGRR